MALVQHPPLLGVLESSRFSGPSLAFVSHVGLGGGRGELPRLPQLLRHHVQRRRVATAVVPQCLFTVEEDEEIKKGRPPGRGRGRGGGGGGEGRDFSSSWEDRQGGNAQRRGGRGHGGSWASDSSNSSASSSSKSGYGGRNGSSSSQNGYRGRNGSSSSQSGYGGRNGSSSSSQSGYGGRNGSSASSQRGYDGRNGSGSSSQRGYEGRNGSGSSSQRGYEGRNGSGSASQRGYEGRNGSGSASHSGYGGRYGGLVSDNASSSRSGGSGRNQAADFGRARDSRGGGDGQVSRSDSYGRGRRESGGGDPGRRFSGYASPSYAGNGGDRDSRRRVRTESPSSLHSSGEKQNSTGNSGSQDWRDAGNYAGRNRSRGLDSRGISGEGRGGSSGKGRSKTPNTFAQTITPKQSASDFVSNRNVHRAPWEQGGRSSSGSSKTLPERDYTQRNPLIERLQRMQEEIEYDEEEDEADGEEDEEEGPDLVGGFEDDDSPFREKVEKSAMGRIVEKLSSLPGSSRVYQASDRTSADGLQAGDDSVFVPKYGQPMLPNVGPGWSTPDHPVPTPAAIPVQKGRPDTRFPWEREDEKVGVESPEKIVRVKPPTLAELTVPEDELKRLRSLGILARHRVKVGKMGVTNGIVESIQNEWRSSEVVRVKCEGPPAMNMKRTHETLEERTGGLVVWRAGGACLVYRGKDYGPPALNGRVDLAENALGSLASEGEEQNVGEEDKETVAMEGDNIQQLSAQSIVVPRVNSVYDPELERELEEILSTLGPRYDDWTGVKPVPVDADLLLGTDANFKKPYRVLPYGVRPNLSNLEMTNLRKLARPIPPHFVLGVNKNLAGLAASIVKLWEKSEIAKISVKRGIQNTNHERMAEQLKRLTGGVLLARDKFFIVLYRGKDFLPPSVARVLEEREVMTRALQEEEEKFRFLPKSNQVLETSVERGIAGTLAETLQAKANWENLQTSEQEQKNREDARQAAKNDITRRIQKKVFVTTAKIAKAESDLEKSEKRLRPAGPPIDRENITDEERHMYSKLGLKMHAFLLLGRRGIFDGTVENMHLHWKHRELVKVIYKARDKIDLEQTARMLEYESGGILVATVATNKGQAIIVYRGKNYQRPPELRPRTLLTKRQALKRSIEMQRQKALMKHLRALKKEMEFMQADLSKLEEEEGSSETTVHDLEDSLDAEETKESIIFSGFKLPENDEELIGDGSVGYLSKRGKLDAIFRAHPLSSSEKLVLRKQALKKNKQSAHFNIGRDNVVEGLARAIRIHFQKHALVKIGVRGRAHGTPIEETLHQLEEATGGTLVSDEGPKIILYRGWPEGQERPTEGNGHWEELAPELRSAMISEAEADEDYLHESDWDESGDEDEEINKDDFENDEDGDFLQARNTLDYTSEGGDDSDWDEFDEEQDEDEDDLQNELELDFGEDELNHDESVDIVSKIVVNDAV